MTADAPGFTGASLLDGGAGNDTVTANGADDRPSAESAADFNGVAIVVLPGGLFGGAGNDVLDGGAGADTCTGTPGVDTFVDCEVIVEA